MQELARGLQRIDGRSYKAYKELEGRRFDFPHFELVVDHVQADPFAAPSRMRGLVPTRYAALPEWAVRTPDRLRAARDFLVRSFHAACRSERDLAIDGGRQTVLDRSACLVTSEGVEFRFTVRLPAAGRRILGRQARGLLVDRLPRIVDRSVLPAEIDLEAMERHCRVVEDQVALRSALPEAGLVAFVANGSLLPRRSGVDDRPRAEAIAVESPPSLEHTLQTPNSGPVSGMGVPTGITLVVGGGFHGKSTLLRAIAAGVYDHIPGDGRERVVSDPTTAKIRAEDGRAVSGVDISAFIDRLPDDTPTESFSTQLASGSTSQAAALVEALETGASLLLLDEDTSATNFMIRDRRMQALVPRESEPITPFVDRVPELRDRLGISTVLVMGGSGDYFDHADTVIQMDSFKPRDLTEQTRAIAKTHHTGRLEEHTVGLELPRPRKLAPGSLNPERKPGRTRIQARGLDTLVFGRTEVDLRAVDQLEHASQVRAIGWIMVQLAGQQPPKVDPRPLIEEMCRRLTEGDWHWLTGRPDGDLVVPRPHEVMAALNRLRGVEFAD
jgi:predicted ABC-class ATPase